MAPGIRKGSSDAKQFLDKTLSPNYKGIENSQYQERAKVGGEFLQNLFTKEELHYFRKTELKQIEKGLKQREAQDRTRTIAAREHKAEAMLNAFKSSHSEGPFIKGALNSLGHIQAVFKGINPADIQEIKNPLLQNLASLACGHGNKKNAAATFASQVLQNPTYLFSDLRQAKLFLSRFLRQHGLGSLSRLLRRRGRRAHQRVMEKLQGYKGAFDRSVVSLSAKKRMQKVFSPPAAKKALKFIPQNEGIEAPKLSKPSREQAVKESPEPLESIVRDIPPAPPLPSSVKTPLSQEVARPPQADGLRVASSIPEAPSLPKAMHPEDISLDDAERMVADLGPIASNSGGPRTNPPRVSQGNLSMDKLMLNELDKERPRLSDKGPMERQAGANSGVARPQTVAKPIPTVPSPGDEELNKLNRLLAELEQPNVQVSTPAQGQNVRVDTSIPDAPPLPGSIPPPPPPPGNMGSQGRPKGFQRIVAAEAIKTLDELVSVNPADNQGRSSTGKCEIAPQDMSKVEVSIFRSLSIDKIKAFSPEQIASMTEEQQKAIPVEVISLVVARAIQAPGGLNPEQRDERDAARKALACLDPKLVRGALENSQDVSHKLYIEPKTVQGKQTDDLSSAYKEIRRNIFKTPYKPGEALSRLTLEQIANMKKAQATTAGGDQPDVLDAIRRFKKENNLKTSTEDTINLGNNTQKTTSASVNKSTRENSLSSVLGSVIAVKAAKIQEFDQENDGKGPEDEDYDWDKEELLVDSNNFGIENPNTPERLKNPDKIMTEFNTSKKAKLVEKIINSERWNQSINDDIKRILEAHKETQATLDQKYSPNEYPRDTYPELQLMPWHEEELKKEFNEKVKEFFNESYKAQERFEYGQVILFTRDYEKALSNQVKQWYNKHSKQMEDSTEDIQAIENSLDKELEEKLSEILSGILSKLVSQKMAAQENAKSRSPESSASKPPNSTSSQESLQDILNARRNAMKEEDEDDNGWD